MHPELRDRFEALEARRHRLVADLDRYTPEQQTFRPSPGAWSVRDVAEHLLRVEQGVLQAASGPQRPDPGRRTLRHAMGALLVRLVFALGIRVRMPVRGIQPRGQLSLAELVRQWDEARAEMAGFLRSIAPDQVRQPLLRHPVAGPLDLAGGLDFLARHWDHHLRQIRRIRRAPGFPV